MEKQIYTVGSSNRELEEFFRLLGDFGIKALVDIRRFPTGHFDYFKHKNLANEAEKRGLNYIYMGPRTRGVSQWRLSKVRGN